MKNTKMYCSRINMLSAAACLLVLLSSIGVGYGQDQDLLNKIREYRSKLSGNSMGMSSPGIDMQPDMNFNPELDFSAGNEAISFGNNLDRKIDPEEYIVGPGDKMSAHVWGSTERTYTIVVNPEGKIIISPLGSYEVTGNSFSEVRDLLEKELSSFHRKSQVVVELTGIRRFRCHVYGEVVNPGTYEIDGATRVSEALDLAMGLTEKANRRLIVLKSPDSGERTADLALFEQGNALEANPYIASGERIFVPPIEQVVSVFGFVHYPGTYGYRFDDNLESVIRAAGGSSRGADSSRIILTRFIADHGELRDTVLHLPESKGYRVFPDDRILVSGIPEYRVHRSVQVLGEVEYPGVYPISKNQTRLAEVIGMAGGFTSEAFLKGSVIRRKNFTSPGNREFERVKNTPLESLTPIERSYLKSKLVEEAGRISIDFSELFKKGKKLHDVILRDGDVINIARKGMSVHVTGAVVSPGLVTYRPGAGHDFYIRQAGGYNTRARKHQTMIIKAGTGIWLKPREVDDIEAGDAIYVPEKEYRDGVQVLKDVLVILGSAATVVLSSLTIRDLVSR